MAQGTGFQRKQAADKAGMRQQQQGQQEGVVSRAELVPASSTKQERLKYA